MTYEEVYSSLRTREFTLMDEVSKSCSRWTYISETPEFKSVVNEIRHINLKHGDDDTTQGQDTNASHTQTLSLTDAVNPAIEDDITEDLSETNQKASNKAHKTEENVVPFRAKTNDGVEDAFYQSFDDLNRDSQFESTNSYVYEGDPRALRSRHTNTKWLWVLTILIVSATLIYIGFSQFVAKPIQERNLAEVQVKTGLDAYDIGDYKVALEFLNQAYSINPNEKSILLPLAVLEIRENGETVKALRLIDQLKGDQADSRKIATVKGLAALADEDYELAYSEFDKALKLDSFYQPAIINLGITSLYKDDLVNARSFLEMANKDNNLDDLTHLMMAEAYFKSHEKGTDKKLIEKVLGGFDFHIRRSRPYYRQKLVAKMYSLKILGKNNELMDLLPEFLDNSLVASAQFKDNPLIHKAKVDNNLYSQWCLKALSDLEPAPYVVSAEAVCLYMGGNLMGANDKIEDAIAQAPKDRLINAVYASLLFAMNSPERAKSAVEKSLSLESERKWRLPFIAAARLCMNIECSEKYWQEVLKIDSRSLEAHTQLAGVYFANGRIGEAQHHIKKALEVNPNFTAALDLKLQLKQATSVGG